MNISFPSQNKIKIDWQKLAAVEIQELNQNCGIDILQDNLNYIAFCDAESELNLSAFSEQRNLLKMFRIAQLLIQYLFLSQEYLEDQLNEANKGIATYKAKYDEIRTKFINQVAEAKKMKTNIKNMKETVKFINSFAQQNTLYQPEKCHFCTKLFRDKSFLMAHLERKHPNESILNGFVEMKNEDSEFFVDEKIGKMTTFKVQTDEPYDIQNMEIMVAQLSKKLDDLSTKLIEQQNLYINEKDVNIKLKAAIEEEKIDKTKFEEELYNMQVTLSHIESSLPELNSNKQFRTLTDYIQQQKQEIENLRHTVDKMSHQQTNVNIKGDDRDNDKPDLQDATSPKYKQIKKSFNNELQVSISNKKHKGVKVLSKPTRKLKHNKKIFSVAQHKPEISSTEISASYLCKTAVNNDKEFTEWQNNTVELNSKKLDKASNEILDVASISSVEDTESSNVASFSDLLAKNPNLWVQMKSATFDVFNKKLNEIGIPSNATKIDKMLYKKCLDVINKEKADKEGKIHNYSLVSSNIEKELDIKICNSRRHKTESLWKLKQPRIENFATSYTTNTVPSVLHDSSSFHKKKTMTDKDHQDSSWDSRSSSQTSLDDIDIITDGVSKFGNIKHLSKNNNFADKQSIVDNKTYGKSLIDVEQSSDIDSSDSEYVNLRRQDPAHEINEEFEQIKVTENTSSTPFFNLKKPTGELIKARVPILENLLKNRIKQKLAGAVDVLGTVSEPSSIT